LEKGEQVSEMRLETEMEMWVGVEVVEVEMDS
jgi:hypothetical protein